MNVCRACNRHNQNYLCDDCTDALTNMLDEIPWLLQELDNRIQKLDRTHLGTIGRSRRPDELNIMDFDAAETAREVRKTLLKWVTTVAQKHTGRTPPALTTVTTPDLARWLKNNTTAIARLGIAGKLYKDIDHLVSTTQDGGKLHKSVNPTEQHSAGPCPTITGKNRNGTPRQCGEMLFADTYDRNTTCPACGQTIDVETNRKRAAADRDLHTKTDLVEVLANIDEPVTKHQVDQWIRARRLRPQGWKHEGSIVEFRITDRDEPVYSIDRARKLRLRDASLRNRQRHRATL